MSPKILNLKLAVRLNSESPKFFFSFYHILLLETRKVSKEFTFMSDSIAFIACLKTQLI